VATREVDTPAYMRLLDKLANWDRWGADDELGTANLIDAQKRIAAAGLVRKGRAVSLGRPIPTMPQPGVKRPAAHFMSLWGDWEEGGAEDFLALLIHGAASTHLDAIGHGWQRQIAWNRRDPAEIVTMGGGFQEPGVPGEGGKLRWGAVDQLSGGIFTRGVLLDVPRHRGVPYVTVEEPVHGQELAEIASAQNISPESGDALLVYCGRDAWNASNSAWGSDPVARPGLHASCLEYFKDVDCAVLVWDMHDARPSGIPGIEFAVHAALSVLGLPLVDHAYLQELSKACEEEETYEFLFTVAPLRLIGGTGSPVNPIALF
jgi:kynurenine formamidase